MNHSVRYLRPFTPEFHPHGFERGHRHDPGSKTIDMRTLALDVKELRLHTHGHQPRGDGTRNL
jgi:hypothetical protein